MNLQYFNGYSVFSLIALLIKFFVVFKFVKNKNKIDTPLTWLLLFLFGVNLIAFLGLAGIIHSIIGFKLFYVFLILALGGVLNEVLFIANIKQPGSNVIYLFGVVLASILFVSDYIVAGAMEGGIGYTRIPGDFYFVFQTYAFLCLILSLWFVLKTVYNERITSDIRARTSVLLTSLLPLVLGLLYVLIRMAAGHDINAGVILPIATTAFLAGCCYAHSAENIFDCSIFYPLSPSFHQKKPLFYFMFERKDKTGLWPSLLEIEKLYLKQAMESNEGKGQLTNAAKDLGASISKLDYRLREVHKIKK